MRQSEVKELSDTELKEKLGEVRKQYLELKLAHAVTPLENPLRLRQLRRTVARLTTEHTKRKLQ